MHNQIENMTENLHEKQLIEMAMGYINIGVRILSDLGYEFNLPSEFFIKKKAKDA